MRTLSLFFVFVTALPAAAGHYQWGRTDAAVAEPGAYAIAFILVPVFIIFLIAGLSMITTADPVIPAARRQRTPTRRSVDILRQYATAFLHIFKEI